VTLHPQVKAMLEALAESAFVPMHEMSPDAARRQFLDMAAARPPPEFRLGGVSERMIPGPARDLRVRVYHPPDVIGPLPAVAYFHGGGHVFGNLDSHDGVARGLCARARCVIVSVDYRLAPEAPFPAAVDDAFAATVWLAANAAELGVDPQRLAVAGDSAGANLAAVVALMARDAGGPALKFQLLVYPIVDYAARSASYDLFATGYGVLEARTMDWFRDHYLGAGDAHEDWRASPMRAPSLAGLPPALVITAGHDVLHDEGVAYAERLRSEGCEARHLDYPGAIHGFFSMAPLLDDAVAAQEEAARALRAALDAPDAGS